MFKIIFIVIQLKWLIEEKHIIKRKEVWFNPIKLTIIEKKIEINQILLIIGKNSIIISGLILSQVERINIFIQEIFLTTLGYQKWKGNNPSLRIIEKEINVSQKIFILIKEMGRIDK